MNYRKLTIKQMKNLHVNIDYSDLTTHGLNKGVSMTSVDNNNNDSCFSDDAFIEIQHLKHKSI